MGKRQAFIDLARAGGSRQDFIDLANSFRGIKPPVHDPFEQLMIHEMLMSGALPSELKHGGIASLAPRSGYAQGIGPVGEGQYNPVGEGDWLINMPNIDPNILRLIREHKKRQGLARILEV